MEGSLASGAPPSVAMRLAGRLINAVERLPSGAFQSNRNHNLEKTMNNENVTMNSLPEPLSFPFEGGLKLSVIDRNGEYWFVASDVCKALGFRKASNVTRLLDADEKGASKVSTLGGLQEVTIINESGLYSLIFSSKKPTAKKFKKWVTATVLPSLRRYGGYIQGMEALGHEDHQEAVEVIRKEAVRVGLCREEEREARSGALRLLKRGGKAYPCGR